MDLAEGHVAALKKLESDRVHLQVTTKLQHVAIYNIIFIMERGYLLILQTIIKKYKIYKYFIYLLLYNLYIIII